MFYFPVISYRYFRVWPPINLYHIQIVLLQQMSLFIVSLTQIIKKLKKLCERLLSLNPHHSTRNTTPSIKLYAHSEGLICECLRRHQGFTGGGADQNDSCDTVETYTEGTSLSGVRMVGSRRSCHLIWRSWVGLLCPVMLFQKTCDWMVYVFNVAGIGSITVTLGKTTKTIRPNQRAHLCVFSACVCADY